MKNIYIDDDRLDAIADAILRIDPCPVTGMIRHDQIIMAIGEAGNVWPESILPDAIAAQIEHREKYSSQGLRFCK